jgi:transcriptional regulator with XRE-family HTH domain
MVVVVDGFALPDNVARLRKARNLSQEQLAEATLVGVDTIGRIERGIRRNVRPETLARLARALGTTPLELLGAATRTASAIDAGLLRRGIAALDDIDDVLDPTEDQDLRSIGQLSSSGRRAWVSYVAGRTEDLLIELPPLLSDARKLARTTTGDANADAHGVLTLAYRLGAGLAGRVGLNDLAWISAERALSASRRSRAPELETAVSLRYLVWVLVRQGRTLEAEELAIRAAQAIEPRILDRDEDRAGVFGNLLFNAASAAIASGHGDRARDYLRVARAAAVRFGQHGRANEAAIFGPRVVGLQTVEAAVRMGEPAAALGLAKHLSATDRTVPRFWESGHHLHLARAAIELRHNGEGLAHLTKARETAPLWSARQPLGRSLMTSLLERSSRRRDGGFAELAQHFGAAG